MRGTGAEKIRGQIEVAVPAERVLGRSEGSRDFRRDRADGPAEADIGLEELVIAAGGARIGVIEEADIGRSAGQRAADADRGVDLDIGAADRAEPVERGRPERRIGP